MTDLRERIAAELIAARARTALLTDSVDEADLVRQHSPLMSPLVWDLAHIANQEELWLLRQVGGIEPMHPEIDPLYDAFEHPRSERPTLPLLPPAEARAYGHEVRGRVLDLLDRVRFDSASRLEVDGFAFGMIAQHEVQHDETMLITHQLRTGAAVLAEARPPAADASGLPSEVLVPGGPFTMGTSADPWALDNERPAHVVDVPSFYLDTTPVTCGAYLEFIADGGYDSPRWWSTEGWKHRQQAGLVAPLYWSYAGGGQWVRRVFGRTSPVDPAEPVVHVSWYEADAYARWAGRRLPTEAEWEKAARHDPATGESRPYPWGSAPPAAEVANLSQRFLRPAPAGSYPAGAAPCGARQLIGDVWEWTSSDFGPYPGFSAWPYREYSEVFFGPEYKVLRGGSFAVSPVACRSTFRNWDYPVRRQIFAGFRTARSATDSGTRGVRGVVPPQAMEQA